MDFSRLKMATKSLILLPLKGRKYFPFLWVWTAYDCFDHREWQKQLLASCGPTFKRNAVSISLLSPKLPYKKSVVQED